MRSLIPPLLLLASACLEAPNAAPVELHDQASILATSTGAETAEAQLVAQGLLRTFSRADAVVTGVVEKIDTQTFPGREQREMTVVTLAVRTTLSGSLSSSGHLRFWSWRDAENLAEQLTVGAEIAVGLKAHPGQKDSYALIHPHAIVALDAEKLVVPHFQPTRQAFAESMRALRGGVR